jgi:hypothetical protein
MYKLITISLFIFCSITYGQRPLPMLLNGHIKLEAGVYVVPVNFSMDFRDTDITIEGVQVKQLSLHTMVHKQQISSPKK